MPHFATQSVRSRNLASITVPPSDIGLVSRREITLLRCSLVALFRWMRGLISHAEQSRAEREGGSSEHEIIPKKTL